MVRDAGLRGRQVHRRLGSILRWAPAWAEGHKNDRLVSRAWADLFGHLIPPGAATGAQGTGGSTTGRSAGERDATAPAPGAVMGGGSPPRPPPEGTAHEESGWDRPESMRWSHREEQ